METKIDISFWGAKERLLCASVIVRWRGIPLQWACSVTLQYPVSAYLCKRVSDGREQFLTPVQITAREKNAGKRIHVSSAWPLSASLSIITSETMSVRSAAKPQLTHEGTRAHRHAEPH